MGIRCASSLAVLLTLAACGEEDYSDCGWSLPLDVDSGAYSREATLDAWAGPVRDDGSREFCSYIVEGSCADGKRFIAQAGGFGTYLHYFDDAGELVAMASQGDIIFDHCDGGFFAPSLSAVRCDSPEWTPLCGDGPAEISLPFGDGATPLGIVVPRDVQP